MSSNRLLAGGLLVGLVLAVGCGPAEPKLYRVHGTVTYGGQPVPKGLIFFDPTTDGPQAFAEIEGGAFDTAKKGKGARPGAYNLRINAFDGKPSNDAPFGQALCPEFTDKKTLPDADSELAIELKKK